MTRLPTGDVVAGMKPLEAGSFDVKPETVLVGVYTLVVYLVLAGLTRRTEAPQTTPIPNARP